MRRVPFLQQEVQFSSASQSSLTLCNPMNRTQHARPLCPSPTPEVHPNPCPLSSSSILASRIPWTEEPGGLQFIGMQSQTRLKQLSIHVIKAQKKQEYRCNAQKTCFEKRGLGHYDLEGHYFFIIYTFLNYITKFSKILT